MREGKRARARENNETIVVDSSIGGRGDHCCQVVKGGGEILWLRRQEVRGRRVWGFEVLDARERSSSVQDRA